MKKITVTLLVIFCLHNGKVFGLTGGVPAEDGEFPFVVSVKDVNSCHVMAGTILSPTWILSSAAGRIFLRKGSVGFGRNALANNQSYMDCGPYDSNTQRKISGYYINEDAWSANLLTHDLTLINLEEAIPFGDNVQPVRLPEGDEPWPYLQNGTMVGWGYEGGIFPATQTNLQKAEVSTYNDVYCHAHSGLYSLFNATVMKCGGEAYKAFFCIFDYGGPFIINGTQYGIISYIGRNIDDTSFNCGEFIGIFAPTVTYRDWIREISGV